MSSKWTKGQVETSNCRSLVIHDVKKIKVVISLLLRDQIYR